MCETSLQSEFQFWNVISNCKTLVFDALLHSMPDAECTVFSRVIMKINIAIFAPKCFGFVEWNSFRWMFASHDWCQIIYSMHTCLHFATVSTERSSAVQIIAFFCCKIVHYIVHEEGWLIKLSSKKHRRCSHCRFIYLWAFVIFSEIVICSSSSDSQKADQ